MREFNLNTEYIALCDLLKTTGMCESGGAAKVAIAHGLVKVDGEKETRKACKIRPGQKVEFQGEEITVR
mgnify:CR=1 FL=1